MTSVSGALWTEQLALVQVPEGEWPDVYLLGIPASRITFADQQKRAFNMIAALLASDRIRADDALGIVGGGVGGITAGAYAAQFNIKVTVFDQYAEAMAIQQGSNRWIHPNLYDWPARSWKINTTRFPCMNWTAATAAEVIRVLRSEWNQLVGNKRVHWKHGTRIIDIVRSGDQWVLKDESTEHGPFKVIVLAVGFGEEEAHEEFDCKPYWRNDDLNQRLRSGGTVLVSGCGDGGLVDAVRALSIDFHHEQFVSQIAGLAATAQLEEELLRIETDRPRFPDGAALTDAYRNLHVPAEVDSLLSHRIKPDTVVTINGQDEGLLSRKSSILNRFLISRLLHIGRAKYLRGQLDSSFGGSTGSAFTVKIDGVEHEFNHVVIRHGPRPFAIDAFDKIGKTMYPARSFFRIYRDVVDRTRYPLWNEILASKPHVRGVAPNRSLNPVDARYVEFMSEQAHILLKDELISVRPSATVSRKVGPSSVLFTIHDNAIDVGTVQLDIASTSHIVIMSARGASGTESAQAHRDYTDVARTDASDTKALLGEVRRILRTMSYLIGGADE